MNTRQIRRVPVVENGRLIGMVSLSDIANSGVRKARKSRRWKACPRRGGELRQRTWACPSLTHAILTGHDALTR